MRIETDSNPGARERRARTKRERSRTARAPRTAGSALIAVACAACAFSNHDFDGLTELGDRERGSRLSAALERERADGGHDEIYDVRVVPLARTSLTVFAAESDDDRPEGYVETDIDAYLPLFGVVDATFRHYDADRRMYERQDHRSYLWGLLQSHREQLDTDLGVREEKERTLLWVFRWRSSPRYVGVRRD